MDYVSETCDIDRTGELFSWIWDDWFGKKNSPKSTTSGSASVPAEDNLASVSLASTSGSMDDLVVITLGGGCFWCIDACYRNLKGVRRVISGYAGGNDAIKPNYQMVCTGVTGHAEVVQVTFDPEIVSLEEILDVFFTIHDPTQLNRQGNDQGTWYRSMILCSDAFQHAAVDEYMVKVKTEYSKPVVTEIVDIKKFFKAETYHQDYFRQNPFQGYCQMVVAPKVKKFSQKYASKLV
jgi:peptide-methionine (S)-S-oxide reductase